MRSASAMSWPLGGGVGGSTGGADVGGVGGGVSEGAAGFSKRLASMSRAAPIRCIFCFEPPLSGW